MKKHITICYLIACIGLIVGLFVIIYTALISELKFKYPILWGSCSIVGITMIRLSYLKKIKNKVVYYYETALMVILFTMSVIDL